MLARDCTIAIQCYSIPCNAMQVTVHSIYIFHIFIHSGTVHTTYIPTSSFVCVLYTSKMTSYSSSYELYDPVLSNTFRKTYHLDPNPSIHIIHISRYILYIQTSSTSSAMTATRQEGATGGGRPPAGELLVYWDDDPSDSDSDNDKEDHSSVSGDEGELEDEVEIWGSFGRLSLQRASYREIMNQGLYASTGSAVLDALNEAQSGMKKRFADQQEQDEDQSVMTWRKSIRKSLTNMSKNLEVFEPGYRATNGQNAIIAKLENQLFGPDTAFRKMSRRRSSGGTSSSNLSGPDLAHVVLHSHAMTIDSEAHSFIRYSGQTVLLKKGPVTYQKVIEEKKGLFTFKGSESSGKLNEFYVEEPRELILFNNSILIASLEAVANNESRDIWNRIVESLVSYIITHFNKFGFIILISRLIYML